GDLGHFGDVVNANDVRAGEDTGSDCGGGGPQALIGRSGFGVARERCSEKALARGADEEWVAEFGQLREPGKELVVLREAFAEADAGIEDELRSGDASFASEGERF